MSHLKLKFRCFGKLNIWTLESCSFIRAWRCRGSVRHEVVVLGGPLRLQLRSSPFCPLSTRDIKCANILVHADGSVKLADFGLSKMKKLNDVKSCKGTAFWMAPEVVEDKFTFQICFCRRR